MNEPPVMNWWERIGRDEPVWAPAPPWSTLAEPPNGPLQDIPAGRGGPNWDRPDSAADDHKPRRSRVRRALVVAAAVAVGIGATLAVQALIGDDEPGRAASSVPADGSVIELRGHLDSVHTAAFSPDGSLALTAAADGRIIVWDARNGDRLTTIGETGDYVATARFDSTSSRILAVVNGDVAIIDAETGEDEASISESADVTSAVLTDRDAAVVGYTFDPDSYASVETAVTRWDAATGDELSTIDEGAFPEALSADGELVALSTSDDEGSTITEIWNVADASVQSTLDVVQEFVYYADGAAFSDDGNRIARVTSEYTEESFEALTSVWDAATGDLLATLDDPAASDVVSVVFDHSGDIVMTTAFGSDFFTSTLTLWNAESGERIRTITREAVGGAAFSPDNSVIAVATADSTITIWDTESGDEVAVLAGHIGAINSIDFSPNGRRLVTASNDGTARIWDLDLG